MLYRKGLGGIKSGLIKSISNYLAEQGHKIIHVGRPWSNVNADWVYFDTLLDIDHLISQFDHSRQLKVHQNTDPKSGLEKGLIDKSTGESIMGLLK